MIVGQMLSWRIVIRYTGRPVVLHVVFALCIAAAYELLGADWLAVPALPVSVLAAALGILLAFRNNSAYDRWWEARTLWGSLVNTSRSFARQVLTFLPAPLNRSGDGQPEVAPATPRLMRTAGEPASPVLATFWSGASDGAVRDALGKAREAFPPVPLPTRLVSLDMKHESQGAPRGVITGLFEGITEDARELVYAQIGFVNALRCHLRRQDPFPEIAPFFRPSVIEALRDEHNVPAAILLWISTRLRLIFGQVHGEEKVFLVVALNNTLNELTNILGACERIKNTPLPRQYDILPRAMVRAYLAMLPLGVVSDLGWLTPLVTAIIAFLFIAMDAVGHDVENPFENNVSDTPMTALSRTIEINLRQALGETELPPPVQPINGLLY
ncbi:bestrophin family ion channel [Stigmatella sp. ncwal1]|uniref:Bestrophin family ion channel n=1 Tax=Stigmatella ashevillensis TaxID=2995309 RepID=A0ABT5DHS0_9BACT|nr:bestrophin family ion channel [Stigmatella ashevillena]MDC0713205.1 bestrophin family ion channel [Stigmatella ashevillena]